MDFCTQCGNVDLGLKIPLGISEISLFNQEMLTRGSHFGLSRCSSPSRDNSGGSDTRDGLGPNGPGVAGWVLGGGYELVGVVWAGGAGGDLRQQRN